MIQKVSAKSVNTLFEKEVWKYRTLRCGVCTETFQYEPYIYTYSDGQQTICCSTKCHEAIRLRLKHRAVLEDKQHEP